VFDVCYRLHFAYGIQSVLSAAEMADVTIALVWLPPSVYAMEYSSPIGYSCQGMEEQIMGGWILIAIVAIWFGSILLDAMSFTGPDSPTEPNKGS
jgi:hypothetical protein